MMERQKHIQAASAKANALALSLTGSSLSCLIAICGKVSNFGSSAKSGKVPKLFSLCMW